MPAKTTKVTVRVQANGGKFLGDDIGGAAVTIRDATTGELLATGVTRGDSGTVAASYSDKASRQAIVTPGKKPTIQWVAASATTSSFEAKLQLERPTLLEVTAYGSLAGLQTAHRATATQWVVPGEHVTAGPGFLVVLPGLLVQVMEPPTHLELSSTGVTVPLKANVTMMCGCPIATNEPWIPKDFEVFADIRQVGAAKGTRVPLGFDGTQPSLFVGSYKVKKAAFYEAAVSAIQKSTGNTGAGLVTFFVKTSG